MKDQIEKVMNQYNSEKDIFEYKWKLKPKYKNDSVVQNSVKLIDCSIEELEGFLRHCNNMLYNPDPWKPGRIVLYDEIPVCIKLANLELCRRYLIKEYNTVDFKLISFFNNKLKYDGVELIEDVFDVPSEFRGLLLSDLVRASLDKLGTFNKKPITLTFILEQGVWLNAEEKSKIKGKNKISQILKILNLNISHDSLDIKPEGLSLTEMKALINIKRIHRYRDMSDTQLELLRDKVLFLLQNKIKNQIKGWDSRIENINKVIEYKKQQES